MEKTTSGNNLAQCDIPLRNVDTFSHSSVTFSISNIFKFLKIHVNLSKNIREITNGQNFK